MKQKTLLQFPVLERNRLDYNNTKESRGGINRFPVQFPHSPCKGSTSYFKMPFKRVTLVVGPTVNLQRVSFTLVSLNHFFSRGEESWIDCVTLDGRREQVQKT